MADLHIRIVVDNEEANRQLAATDKHVDAVGATAAKTSKSTGTLEKSLGGVGSVAQEVGKGLLAAFTVKAVFDGISLLISSSLAYADALTKLQSSTRISVEDLQRLEAVGRPAGVSLNDMADAVNALKRNLDSPKGRDAIAKMGLDYKELRDLKPVDLFLEIGQSVQQIHDPIDQANAKTALFGRTFDKVASAFDQNAKEMAKGANVLSKAEVGAIAEMGAAWGELTHAMSIAAKRQVADFALRLQAWKALADAVRGFPTELPPTLKPPTILRPLDPVIKNFEDFGRIAKEQNEKIAEATKKREAAETKAAKEFERTEKAYTEGLERMRFANFKLGESALKAAQDTSPLLMRMSEFVTIGNDYSKTLMEAQIKTDAFGHVMPNVVQHVADLGAGIGTTGETVKTFGEQFKDTMLGLVTNTSKVMGDLQSKLTSKLSEMFGGGKEGGLLHNIIGGGLNMVFGPVSGLIVSLVTKGMAKMGEIVLGGLRKIGGFFKDLFGGPSAKELAGREVVEQFSKNIETMLTDAQKIEAGNEQWKKTVIVVRDAYLAMGKTEQDALDDVKAMWDAEKGGAEAAKAAVDRINEVLRRMPRPDAPWSDWPPPPEVPDYDNPGDRGHTGGLITAHGLERYHKGGRIGGDERMIIAQTGEGILNRRAMARMGASNLHALNRGGSAGGPTVTLQPGAVTVYSVIESASQRREIANAVSEDIMRKIKDRYRVVQ